MLAALASSWVVLSDSFVWDDDWWLYCGTSRFRH